MRKSRSEGKRPFQHTVKQECPAFIRFSKRVSGEIVLSSFSNSHNHPCSDSFYDQDTAKIDAKGLTLIETMLGGDCKVSHIKKSLAKEGINLNSNQIRYQVKKLIGAPMYMEKVNELLTNVKEDGGDVNTLNYIGGMVRVLTVTTQKMKNAFIGSKPTVVQIGKHSNITFVVANKEILTPCCFNTYNKIWMSCDHKAQSFN